jgi:hypothetical protein
MISGRRHPETLSAKPLYTATNVPKTRTFPPAA